MYASGRISMAQSPALVLPAECVVIRDGRSFIATLSGSDPTPRVALHAVTIGRRQGSDVEIRSGLAQGDRVIVQGAGFLNDGDAVRVSGDAERPAIAQTGH